MAGRSYSTRRVACYLYVESCQIWAWGKQTGETELYEQKTKKNNELPIPPGFDKLLLDKVLF